MPTRELLSKAQRARFTAIPEMDARELARYHTLSEADLAAVSARRSASNRLGFAVQLCLLRYPGRPLQAGEIVPRNIVGLWRAFGDAWSHKRYGTRDRTDPAVVP